MTTALTPEQRIAALEAELAKFAESECDKIMAMSEEQITALTRMQGSNPDDVAKICRMACDLALKDVAIQRLEAELAACRREKESHIGVVYRHAGGFNSLMWSPGLVEKLPTGTRIYAALAAQEKV